MTEAGWLGGARSAFALTLDFDAEEVWIGADPAKPGGPGSCRRAPTGPGWGCR